ncbi:siderophore-interacting protein [Oerskovia gallyi]|uniref:Siderophore-interacting protein n=1 Tax=Oerskovia gallyi TaxID=2762226 RepID=A0ABR8UXE0_9CELL|nr:siderophore-interacting protein [Oerskovia gallyi]MBD7997080.1 siderophore-interacting protein [Oerskovia gallyi]
MTDPAPRKPERVATHAVVVRTERLTPHMIRVVLGGEGLDGFDPGPHTDRYVKLLFPAAAGPEGRVPMRTYTIRSWDPAAHELAIDFVAHGDEGLAGPWASAAQPGDTMSFFGPGGDYAPSGGYDWHLLVGDESALPAIAAALEAVPDGAPVLAVVEVASAAEEQTLTSPGDLDLRWVHRDAHPDRAPGEVLVEAVEALTFLPGQPQVFLHGDAGFVRTLRRHLRLERGVPVTALSASGYWRRGRTEEGWRAEKADWKAAVALDEEPALHT